MATLSLEQIQAKAVETRGAARDMAGRLSLAFDDLLGGVRSGSEDPVLSALLDEVLIELVRRVGWGSLVINPGSTSTKVAVYSGLKFMAEEEVHIDPGRPDGVEERARGILSWMNERGFSFPDLSGIAARGGFVAPVPTATYRVTQEMRSDLEHAPLKHASNMAVPIAMELGKLVGEDVVITITDPVTSDEVDLVHRITGSSRIRSDGSGAHYLNMKAVCELAGRVLGREKESPHLIACHMGGGVSAARCSNGRMVQVVHAFGKIPSANRAGALPLMQLIRALESDRYGVEDLRREVIESRGGLLSLAGTNNFKALFDFRSNGATERQIEKIDLVIEFFANRVAAGIMELAACEEAIDAILLTGGLARNAEFVELIERRLPLPVPVVRVPGSVESQALAAGLIRVFADPKSRSNYTEARDLLAEKRAAEDELLDVVIFESTNSHEARKPMASLGEIIESAHRTEKAPTIAIVGADNEEALLAAKLANEDGAGPLARFVLLGPYAKISELAWELDVPVDEQSYFVVDSDNPIASAVELIKSGEVDTLLKGSITTANLLRGYFEGLKAMGRADRNTRFSHLGFFEIPGRNKLIGVTDAAINPNPDLETRVAILENALRALHLLGIKRPKVAVISSTEKPTQKVISSIEGEEIAERFAGRDDLIIEGPLSVDLSMSPESAREKGYKGRIQGDADLLLVPTLDVGNAVYKSFTITGGATVAGVVLGSGAPLALASRGDNARSKLASIALALVLGRKWMKS